MDKKKMSIREKLELMKEISRRNEQRRKEHARKKAINERLVKRLERGEISEEEFLRYYRE